MPRMAAYTYLALNGKLVCQIEVPEGAAGVDLYREDGYGNPVLFASTGPDGKFDASEQATEIRYIVSRTD